MLIFYCFIKDILERNWLLFLFFFFEDYNDWFGATALIYAKTPALSVHITTQSIR